MCWDKVIDAEEPAKESGLPEQAAGQASSIERLLKQLLAVRAQGASEDR